jgi:hypothetical protein
MQGQNAASPPNRQVKDRGLGKWTRDDLFLFNPMLVRTIQVLNTTIDVLEFVDSEWQFLHIKVAPRDTL